MSAFRVRVRVSGALIRDGKLLLVAYDDARSGFHYNFPGGGVEQGESLQEALCREMQEEACATVEVGPLIHVWEYIPEKQNAKYGPTPSIGLVFRCTLLPDCEPALPDLPDENQIGVHWIPLEDLLNTPLLPTPSQLLLNALTAVTPQSVQSEMVE